MTSAPAADVVLTSSEKLQEGSARRSRGVHAYTSLPAYLDRDTAVIYVEFACGGHCGEGNFILLKRGAGGWKVRKAAMTWIS